MLPCLRHPCSRNDGHEKTLARGPGTDRSAHNAGGRRGGFRAHCFHYQVLGHTTDEPGHLVCGIRYLQGFTCRYEYAPLARAAIAVGPYFAGARSHQSADIAKEGVAILGKNYSRFLTLARCGVLPFFWIACAALYWWGGRYFGKAVAALSVLFFSLLPPVLAHAGLATADRAQTGCLAAAFLAWLMWAEQPSWPRSIVCGAVTGSAVLAKFATCGFLPTMLVLALAWHLLVERPAAFDLGATLRANLARLCAAGFTAFVTVWAGYQFSVGLVHGILIPALQFVSALHFIADFNTQGQPAFLLGKLSDSGCGTTIRRPSRSRPLSLSCFWLVAAFWAAGAEERGSYRH